ncbi:MAG: ParA family protein [Paracoccaceae bacterium]
MWAWARRTLLTRDETPRDPVAYRAHVARVLEAEGWQVERLDKPFDGWCMTVTLPDGRRGAVQVKSRKSGPMPHPVFNRLGIYLEGPEGDGLEFGINIVNTAFSKLTQTVLQNADMREPQEGVPVFGAVVPPESPEISWILHHPLGLMPETAGPAAEGAGSDLNNRRIAVYTDKGGVGKTSLAAHLAGAICYLGGDAVLVDADPQRNLSTLLGDGVTLVRDGAPKTLIVENYQHFHEEEYHNHYIVYDCSPSFEANPPDVFRRVTDVVIPVVLSPLSILRNASVVDRSIRKIRQLNPNLRIHVVVNQFVTDRNARKSNDRFLNYIRYHLREKGVLNDPKVRFLEPEVVAIRRSNHLLHWGMFLLNRETEQAHLAFDSSRVGAQGLLSDFLALAEVLTEDFEMRRKEAAE